MIIIIIFSILKMENKSNVLLKGTYFILVILLRKCHSYTFILVSYCYCDGSSVQAIHEDLALSQEDGSPTAADLKNFLTALFLCNDVLIK